MNVINSKSKTGGQVYPFLAKLGDWTITSYLLREEEDMTLLQANLSKGLVWNKDDQVNVLTTPLAENGQAILDLLGWQVSFKKSPATASKRISRMVRPYRYGAENVSLSIWEDDTLDAKVWDGVFQVSREFVLKCDQYLSGLSRKKYKRHMAELEYCRRWELTIMGPFGQYKGHAEVVDLPTGIDIRCPVDVAKTEFKSAYQFAGLNAVHGAQQMKLDIQSLINLLNFFGVPNIVQWLEQSTRHVLKGISNSDTPELARMLYNLESAEAIDRLDEWAVGAYIVSGGKIEWFSKAIMGAADQYKNQLRSQNDGMRFPVPGGGAYIAPASMGNRVVEPGKCLLDWDTASLYIADEDWSAYSRRNGGFDADDRHWVVYFLDKADNRHKVLFYRSPNQSGEYLLCEPMLGSDTTAWFDGTIPELNSLDLPLPIESQGNHYGTIERLDVLGMYPDHYEPQALWLTIEQCAKNLGVLGRFCNMLMLHVAVFDDSPHDLPAKLEDVIDFTVKEVGDLSQVLLWIQKIAEVIAARPVPKSLAPRLAGMVDFKLSYTSAHEIDQLTEAMQRTMAWFEDEVSQIAIKAMPPVTLFEYGREHMPRVNEMRSIYGQFLRKVIEQRVPNSDDMQKVKELVQKKLAEFETAEHPDLMYGLVSNVYTLGAHGVGAKDRGYIRDGILFNAVGEQFIETLRMQGIIGDIEWDGQKAELIFNNPEIDPIRPLNMLMKAVWYNLYRLHTKQDIAMGQISKEKRTEYKLMVRNFIPTWLGQPFTLMTSPTMEGRQEFRTKLGNMIALLSTDQSIPDGHYEMVSAIEDDGNLHTVMKGILT